MPTDWCTPTQNRRDLGRELNGNASPQLLLHPNPGNEAIVTYHHGLFIVSFRQFALKPTDFRIEFNNYYAVDI